MEYGVQTHNKFAFLDEDVSDPVETLTKADEEKKKAAVVPLKKISKPLVSAKTLVTKEVPKPVIEKKGGVDLPQKQTVRFGPGERGGGVNNRESSGDQVTKWSENRPQQRRPSNSQKDGADGFTEKRLINVRSPRNEGLQRREVGGGPDGDRPPRRGDLQRGSGGGGRDGNDGGFRHRNFRQGGQRRPRADESKEENKEQKNAFEITEDKPCGDPFAPNEKSDGFHKENAENVEIPVPKDEKKDNDVTPEEQQIPRGKTYEEWKAELNQKSGGVVQFKTRQAGEGVDEKIYQKLVPLKMDKKPEEGGKKQEDDEIAQHKEKREKTLSIDVAFADKRSTFVRQDFGGNVSAYGSGDRQGQRSGPRGSGPRGGGGFRNNFGGAGSSRRPQGKSGQDGFMLESDQFPALGAAH
uniref:HABP4_PAI-RBP1 domain-containing protein n=1 Tax=Meloidogyne hapla TaxID=6305 RepID=A0A1I8BJE5_MELHA